MRTDLTNRIVQRLAQVHPQASELRFGQLIAIIGELAADETGLSLWDIEDADFAAALDRFASDLAKRQSAIAEPGPGGIPAMPGSPSPEPPRQVS
jgi:hypothetical protein